MNKQQLKQIIKEELTKYMNEVVEAETLDDLKQKHLQIVDNLKKSSGWNWRVYDETKHPSLDYAIFKAPIAESSENVYVFEIYENVKETEKSQPKQRQYHVKFYMEYPKDRPRYEYVIGGIGPGVLMSYGKVMQVSSDIKNEFRDYVMKATITKEKPQKWM